jgi:hypothetical protein
MTDPMPADLTVKDEPALRDDARRWVRKKRVLYTMLAVYAVLCVMWLAIDLADGTENLWFYWPVLGTDCATAVTTLVMIGVGGLMGVDWTSARSIATSRCASLTDLIGHRLHSRGHVLRDHDLQGLRRHASRLSERCEDLGKADEEILDSLHEPLRTRWVRPQPWNRRRHAGQPIEQTFEIALHV